MRIREITETRQLNEIAPLVLYGIWAAASTGYSAYQAYNAWQEWKNGELTDGQFAARIGAEAFNALTNFFGGVAAFKAAQMSLSALRRAWTEAGKAAGTAANTAIVATGFNQASATAENVYPEYQKWQRGEYDDIEFKRIVGNAIFDIIQEMLIWYGLSKAVLIPYQAFARGWARLRRRSAPATSMASNTARTAAAATGVAATDAAADAVLNGP